MKFDDWLRRIDDAVGVGFFGRIALEEAHVNGVEEVLLFGVAGRIFGILFDGVVERLQPLEKVVAIQ